MTLLLKLLLLLTASVLTPGYKCTNRLYRGQFLNPGEHLCSRSLAYRLTFEQTGLVTIGEAFPKENYFKSPSSTLFVSNQSSVTPKYLTVTETGELVAVDINGVVFWRTNVLGGSFLELQDTGVAVVLSISGGTTQVLWKSLSMYSLRLVGGTTVNQGRLEIFFNNTWGSVCSTGFESWDANVACRTMGYDSGQTMSNSNFGQSTGPIWMTNVKCRGSQDMFQDCAFNDNEKGWGETNCTHSSDVALQCNGNWTLGVLAPVSYVCTDRLPVGKKLTIGDSLCAGVTGEYALRFSNTKLDTLLTLEYKRKRQWSIGLKSQVVSDATLQIDSNGIARINGTGPRLPYQLFAKTVASASYMELQDNGAVRVASDNGTVGWKKSAAATVEERRGFDYYGHDLAYYQGWSLLSCLDSCESSISCRMAYYNEINDFDGSGCTRGTPCCIHKDAVPWGSSPNCTYYEKISGCSAGASCYKQVNGTNNNGFDIGSATTETSADNCRQRCDNETKCTNFVYFSANSSCNLKWLRINESLTSVPQDAYFLAVSRNKTGYKVYRGCFIDAATRHLSYRATADTIAFNSKLLCTTICATLNYLFAGMEFGGCFCGNAVGLYAQVAESDCNTRCLGNAQDYCGGSWRINIYETGIQDPAGATSPLTPVYIGCFIDAAIRHLPYLVYNGVGFNNKMLCATMCASMGYVYAGMEFEECYCGNWLGRYAQAADTDCSNVCAGNSQEKCGASWRLSVYSTGQPAPTDPDASTLMSYVYKGCFIDAAARDLTMQIHNSAGSNAIRCVMACTAIKYIYAGLEFDECYCGNTVGRYGQVADSQCTSACTGSSIEKCGASWRLTVYETTQLAPTDPAVVVLPNACPSTLLVNHQLLPGERICSSNGKHILVAETDGRVTVDGAQLSVGATGGQTAFLQLTDTFQFLLRLTDTTVKWRIDNSPRAQCSSPVGYLIVSDNGVVQVRNNRDLVIWDSTGARWPMELRVQPLLESDRAKANMLIDFDNSTCSSDGTVAYFSICDVSMNFTVSVTLVGQNLQCANGGGYQFVMMRSAAETGVFPGGRSRPCQLVTANQSACSFECRCELPICNKVVLLRRGCSIEPSPYCEVIIR